MENTTTHFEKQIDEIIANEEKRNRCKIELLCRVHDEKHLDCLWYGGEIAKITYADGWSVLIEANGEVRLFGQVDGEEFAYIEKNNSGRAFWLYYEMLDDERLLALENANTVDNTDDDYLEYENNNWFEVNVITPDGKFIDCGGCCDNVLNNNLLDNLQNVENYYDFVNWARNGEEAHKQFMQSI